jgi:hypothetical protein
MFARTATAWLVALLALWLSAPGCSSSSGRDEDTSTSVDGGLDSGGDTDADSGPDSGAGTDTGTGEAFCPDMDILFMVDNSASMADNQDSLIASFPGFISAIQAQLVHAPSYHIGVVVPDLSKTNPQGKRDIGCLITQTTGAMKSSNKVCSPFSSGGSYIDETEAEMSDKFSCAAKVGIGGADDERPMRAVMNALSPDFNAAGACNEGFHRPDSVLVIVIMTDEDDIPDVCDGTDCETYGSGGEPEEWAQTIIGYKNGHSENVVVLALVGLKSDNTCGAMAAAHMIGFANQFGERGYKGDVCADSYDDFFAGALPIVTSACEDWDVD